MVLVLAVLCSVSLSGCITINTGPIGETPASTPPAASDSPSPAPTPAAAPLLELTIDGIEYSHDGATQLYSYSVGAQIVALFTAVAGSTPPGEFIPQPFTTDVPYATGYDWGFAYVTVFIDSGTSITRIKAAEANGVPIRTKTGGITVGSTVASVTAAGGWNANPSFTDTYGLDKREVPGMDSLMHSGAVGIDFIGLFMESGKVKQIMLLDNDYSDV
jgi:hypothetical protein